MPTPNAGSIADGPSTPGVWVKLTQPPWFALYLVPAGFTVFAVFDRAFGVTGSPWALAAVFFGVLLTLRFGTAIVRRFLPVSRAVKRAWFETRLLAKRHDCYQWQKLLWVGLGILLYAGLHAGGHPAPVVLGVACLAAGGAATARWRSR